MSRWWLFLLVILAPWAPTQAAVAQGHGPCASIVPPASFSGDSAILQLKAEGDSGHHEFRYFYAEAGRSAWVILYAYCDGDPVNRYDPSGLWWLLYYHLEDDPNPLFSITTKDGVKIGAKWVDEPGFKWAPNAKGYQEFFQATVGQIDEALAQSSQGAIRVEAKHPVAGFNNLDFGAADAYSTSDSFAAWWNEEASFRSAHQNDRNIYSSQYALQFVPGELERRQRAVDLILLGPPAAGVAIGASIPAIGTLYTAGGLVLSGEVTAGAYVAAPVITGTVGLAGEVIYAEMGAPTSPTAMVDSLAANATRSTLKAELRVEGELAERAFANGRRIFSLPRSLSAARNPIYDRIEAVLERHGGEFVEGGIRFPTRRAARAAASEIAGDLGAFPSTIRARDYRGGPYWMKDSDMVIGRESLDAEGKSLSGWRDDFLGHYYGPGDELGPHVNVWTEALDNLHLFYGGTP